MKRIIFMLTILFVSTVTALGQAGPGQEKNLRGLKGVRLVVMFGRAGAIDEAERPDILKLVEADPVPDRPGFRPNCATAARPVVAAHNPIQPAATARLMMTA